MRAAGPAEAGRRPGGGAAETGGARLPRRSRGGLRPVCLPLAGGGGGEKCRLLRPEKIRRKKCDFPLDRERGIWYDSRVKKAERDRSHLPHTGCRHGQ